jgi:hypothetical protein
VQEPTSLDERQEEGLENSGIDRHMPCQMSSELV